MPRVGAECMWAEREGDYAHAHNAVAENFQFHMHRPTSSHPRVACLWVYVVKTAVILTVTLVLSPKM